MGHHLSYLMFSSIYNHWHTDILMSLQMCAFTGFAKKMQLDKVRYSRIIPN